MKTIKKLLLIMLCFMTYTAQADTSSKIAYVKLSYIINSLPEKAQAETDINTFRVKLNNQLQSKAVVCQEEMEALNKSMATITDEAKKKKEANIARLYTDFQNFQQECQNLEANKIAELMSPIREKVQQKIKEVCKEKGYDLVLNYSLSSEEDFGVVVIYGIPTLDITDIVLKKLGIDPAAPKQKNSATKDNKPKAADSQAKK